MSFTHQEMSYHDANGRPQAVADKVLRRAKVSQMTRALQDRLALATIKIQHGRQSASISSLPSDSHFEHKRKRTDSNADLFSDTASSTSGQCFSTGIPASSPLTGPVFSDDAPRSGSSQGSFKRSRVDPSYIHPSMTQHRQKGRSTRTTTASWKKSYQLPQSSPIRPRPSVQFMDYSSFASETSTVLDSPSVSEDDDQDLPLHSFQMQMYSDASNIPSSPPRTPSPDASRSAQLSGKAFSPSSSHTFGGKEGADLLLYLATSPSPAMRVNKSSPPLPPSTPPMHRTPLPSSLMNTPGNQLWGFGPSTPNAGFDFAQYCNVTPSPAQRRWSATPIVKTPHTVRARRDGLMPPPSASPNMMKTPVGKGTGLGMELGGELVRK